MIKVARWVTAILAVGAALSAGSVVLTFKNYVEGTRAARSVHVELASVEVKETGSPEVLVVFRLKNDSSVGVTVDALHFNLYINGQYVGTGGPSEQRALSGFEETALDLEIPTRPSFQQYIDQAREKEEFSWSVKGRYKLVLPYKDRVIWLDLVGYWSGRQ
jgi:LEA14-like dessication related protein